MTMMRSLVGLVAVSAVSASPAASCLNICTFGGHNTSCLERITWVKGHVNSWDQVVKKVEPSMALSCGQARVKVVKDCPICQECLTDGLCDYLEYKIGSAVYVLHHNDKWHFGHITEVKADGKYEVTLKYLDIVLLTSHLSPAKDGGAHEDNDEKETGAVVAQKLEILPDAPQDVEISLEAADDPEVAQELMMTKVAETSSTQETTPPPATEKATTTKEVTPLTAADEAPAPKTDEVPTDAMASKSYLAGHHTDFQEKPQYASVEFMLPQTDGVPEDLVMAKKYLELPKVSDLENASPKCIIGMTLGGAVLIGLSASVARKVAKRSEPASQVEEHLVAVAE